MSSTKGLQDKAQMSLEAAQYLFEAGYFEFSISRAYYAMFYIAQAALVQAQVTPKTHAGTLTLFDQHFVKTQRFPQPTARLLRQAYEARQLADYGVEESASYDAAERIIDNASLFTKEVSALISDTTS